MKRLRAGAYAQGDYLIRYFAWLNDEWDGPQRRHLPWHVYRRASHISARILLERLASLEDAKAYVAGQIQKDAERVGG